MPRIRTIKPEFVQSESMGRVSRDARLLFILLWTICDDEGRTRGNSRMLASTLFPYDDDAIAQFPQWISQLESENCVECYVIDGNSYVQVCKWLEHQKIDRPSKSKIPPSRGFDESSRGLVLGPKDQGPKDLRTKDQGSGTKEKDLSCAFPVAVENTTATPNARKIYPPQFCEFWDAYPSGVRKTQKANAYRAWCKEVADGEACEVIAAVREFARSEMGRGQFCPMPATWLAGRQWEDDRTSWMNNGKPKRRSAIPQL